MQPGRAVNPNARSGTSVAFRPLPAVRRATLRLFPEMMVQPRPLGAGPGTQSEERPRDSASTPTDRDRYGPTTRRLYDSMSIADLKPVRRARPLHAVRAAHSCRLDYSFACL